MLELTVLDGEQRVVLQFEHSLLSLSKWEAKHKKPFMADTNKLPTEMIEYFMDMLVSPEVDPTLVLRLEPSKMDEIAHYINDSQTASTVAEPKGGSREVVTSELIYWWLVGLRIPFHPVETWHLNRVMMLVQIANAKQQPAEKATPAELMSDWQKINEENKKRFGSQG